MLANLKQISEFTLKGIQKGNIDLYELVLKNRENIFCLDKSWHAIHFILNQQAWGGDGVLFNTILGGKEIGEDLGYGPVRYLTPLEVVEVARALSEKTQIDLDEKYNPIKMTEAGLYPSLNWGSDEEREYVFVNFWGLVEFYKNASLQGNAILSGSVKNFV